MITNDDAETTSIPKLRKAHIGIKSKVEMYQSQITGRFTRGPTTGCLLSIQCGCDRRGEHMKGCNDWCDLLLQRCDNDLPFAEEIVWDTLIMDAREWCTLKEAVMLEMAERV